MLLFLFPLLFLLSLLHLFPPLTTLPSAALLGNVLFRFAPLEEGHCQTLLPFLDLSPLLLFRRDLSRHFVVLQRTITSPSSAIPELAFSPPLPHPDIVDGAKTSFARSLATATSEVNFLDCLPASKLRAECSAADFDAWARDLALPLIIDQAHGLFALTLRRSMDNVHTQTPLTSELIALRIIPVRAAISSSPFHSAPCPLTNSRLCPAYSVVPPEESSSAAFGVDAPPRLRRASPLGLRRRGFGAIAVLGVRPDALPRVLVL